MINEADLKDALEQLKGELKKQPADVEAVAARVAKEWDVPVKPLMVRFEKTTGKSLTDFAATTFVARDLEQEALAEAREYAKDFRFCGDAEKHVGKAVFLGGEKHLFVACTGRKAFLVRVSDGHRRLWSGSYVKSALKQIGVAAY